MATESDSYELRKRLGDRLRALREERGITQAQLGIRAGLSTSFVSMIERAERSPSFEGLAALAGGLGVPIVELFRAGSPAPRDGDQTYRLVDFARSLKLRSADVYLLIRVARIMFGRRRER